MVLDSLIYGTGYFKETHKMINLSSSLGLYALNPKPVWYPQNPADNVGGLLGGRDEEPPSDLRCLPLPEPQKYVK